MVVRNIKNFPQVYTLLSSFGALPREVIMQITGLSENDFNHLEKTKGIFRVAENMYGLTPLAKSENDFVLLAKSLLAIENILKSNSYITVLKPVPSVIFVSNFKGEKDAVSQALIMNNVTANYIKYSIVPDVKAVFFIVDDTRQIKNIPHSIKSQEVERVHLVVEHHYSSVKQVLPEIKIIPREKYNI